jgi:hypothetical protein
VGAKVVVYVNVLTPSSAVLEPGGYAGFAPFVLALSAFLVFLAALVLNDTH